VIAIWIKCQRIDGKAGYRLLSVVPSDQEGSLLWSILLSVELKVVALNHKYVAVGVGLLEGLAIKSDMSLKISV